MSDWRRTLAGPMALLALAVAWSASGCLAHEADGAVIADADLATFGRDVQPILGRHCANPSCHGRPGALELYAERLHRRDPALVWQVVPLQTAELLHNLRECGARVRVGAAVDDSPLLRSLLRPQGDAWADGGHSFGAIFASSDDPDYGALRSWVAQLPGGP